MENLINKALESIHIFFGGSYSSYESIYPIRTFLRLQVLDMGLMGVTEINKKHGAMFSYLAITNKEETKIVLFVHNGTIKYGEPRFQIFCIENESVLQYKINGKAVFLDDELTGYGGLNILTTAKDFCEGKIAKELTPSANEIALDIVNYIRNPVSV